MDVTGADTEAVKVSFLFTVVGEWENSGSAKDALIVKVGDVDVVLGTFSGKKKDDEKDSFQTGLVGGIEWALSSYLWRGTTNTPN